jgi:hypothetical protein
VVGVSTTNTSTHWVCFRVMGRLPGCLVSLNIPSFRLKRIYIQSFRLKGIDKSILII